MVRSRYEAVVAGSMLMGTNAGTGVIGAKLSTSWALAGESHRTIVRGKGTSWHATYADGSRRDQRIRLSTLRERVSKETVSRYVMATAPTMRRHIFQPRGS